MEDIKLEDIKIDATTTAKDATAVQFIQWVLKKVNDSGINNTTTTELNMLSSGYPGRTMDDNQKIELLKKLTKAGISY
jgi:hypothetical protein